MDLDIELLDRLAHSVLALADQAGEQVMAVYRLGEQGQEHIQLQTKADDSPVTAADLAAHRLLDAALPGLLPDTPVVSEENEASFKYRMPVGRFWLIDPVDGTREFLSRTDEFTVNVALIVDGRAVLGVVFAPALDQMYWGAPGWGAWRRQAGRTQAISVAAFPERDAAGRFARPLLIAASRNHMNQSTRNHIDQLQPHEVLRAGSSLKFCRIAEGAADYYPRLGPTSEWDTAAAQAVVQGAGGQVTTLAGEPLTYGRPEVLNPHFVVTGEPST